MLPELFGPPHSSGSQGKNQSKHERFRQHGNAINDDPKSEWQLCVGDLRRVGGDVLRGSRIALVRAMGGALAVVAFRWLGQHSPMLANLANLLFVTSLLAVLLAFHNAVARSFFALGRARGGAVAGVAFRGLATH